MNHTFQEIALRAVSQQMREQIAKAICASDDYELWDESAESIREDYRKNADAVLALFDAEAMFVADEQGMPHGAVYWRKATERAERIVAAVEALIPKWQCRYEREAGGFDIAGSVAATTLTCLNELNDALNTQERT